MNVRAHFRLGLGLVWLVGLAGASSIGAQEEAAEPAAAPAAEAGQGEETPPVDCPEPPLTDRPGLERLLLEAQARAHALDQRAADLDERERTIDALEAETVARLAELQVLQDRLEQRIAEIEAQSDESIKQLAKVYAAMPPGRAAPLLESLEPVLATQILKRMKYKKSAAVLAVMSQGDALRLSRRVARPLAAEASP